LEAARAVIDRPEGAIDALMARAAPDMTRVDELIIERTGSPVAVIPALADHIINAGGKRLRPLLTIAASRLAGGREEGVLKLAAAVEFIHTATLLHDDVVDASHLRRGKTAAHLIWGAPPAVLVGDFLFARAFELMVETGEMRALEILARASRVIAEGEVLQMSRARDLELDQTTYLEIISAKTAALFAAAAEAGAVSAGAPRSRSQALHDFGLNLGLAFQLADDALDYGGATELLGKNAGDDFREGKATLPLILAMNRLPDRERAFFERVIGRCEQTANDFRRARELLLASGALEATLALAADYAGRAKRALGDFAPGPWRAGLEALADFAVHRRA
jgi:octaprenyl-diphosphate synthase